MKPENCKDCNYFNAEIIDGWGLCSKLGNVVGAISFPGNCPLRSEPDQDELILADMRYPEPEPPTYPIEPIQMMYSIWGADAVYHYCILSAFDCRMRAGEKGDAAQDLEKERWYLNEAKKYNQ
jgi:hypothetical protein